MNEPIADRLARHFLTLATFVVLTMCLRVMVAEPIEPAEHLSASQLAKFSAPVFAGRE